MSAVAAPRPPTAPVWLAAAAASALAHGLLAWLLAAALEPEPVPFVAEPEAALAFGQHRVPTGRLASAEGWGEGVRQAAPAPARTALRAPPRQRAKEIAVPSRDAPPILPAAERSVGKPSSAAVLASAGAEGVALSPAAAPADRPGLAPVAGDVLASRRAPAPDLRATAAAAEPARMSEADAVALEPSERRDRQLGAAAGPSGSATPSVAPPSDHLSPSRRAAGLRAEDTAPAPGRLSARAPAGGMLPASPPPGGALDEGSGTSLALAPAAVPPVRISAARAAGVAPAREEAPEAFAAPVAAMRQSKPLLEADTARQAEPIRVARPAAPGAPPPRPLLADPLRAEAELPAKQLRGRASAAGRHSAADLPQATMRAAHIAAGSALQARKEAVRLEAGENPATPVGVAAASAIRPVPVAGPSDPVRNPAASAEAARLRGAEAAGTTERIAVAALPAGTREGAALSWSGGVDARLHPQSLAAIGAFLAPPAANGEPSLRDALGAGLADLPCSRVAAAFSPETGAIAVRGHARDAALAATAIEGVRAAVGPSIPVVEDMLILPEPQCALLQAIEALGLAQSSNLADDPLVVGRAAQLSSATSASPRASRWPSRSAPPSSTPFFTWIISTPGARCCT